MVNITYGQIKGLTSTIIQLLKDRGYEPKSVYGVPRGGALPAYIISEALQVPLLTNPKDFIRPVLVVDDILDSGKTMDKYKGADFRAVLISKNREKSDQEKLFVAKILDDGEWVTFPWEATEDGSEEIEDNIVRIFEFIGENPKREGLLETPKRVKKAYLELFGGYKEDPEQVLSKRFSSTYDQMVVLKNIEFFSFCEHHMLPFFGSASIAYIPVKKVVGISKLARLVDVYAKRLQIQEQMTEQIASAIETYLNPEGVAVTITAKHFCMVTRGIRKQNSEMTTTSLRGAFKTNPETRAEFFSRI